MYLLFVEVYRIGFIIGTFENKENAQIELEKIWVLDPNRWYHRNNNLIERLSVYSRYNIRNEYYFSSRNLISERSDGELSIGIVELSREWSTVELFIKDREFQTVLFLDDFNPE